MTNKMTKLKCGKCELDFDKGDLMNWNNEVICDKCFSKVKDKFGMKLFMDKEEVLSMPISETEFNIILSVRKKVRVG